MLMQVIVDYTNENLNPIELIKGDTVQLGELSNPNGPYPNWIFCTSQRTKQYGWVAVNALSIDGDVGVAIEDYTAKEMSIAVGDIVDTIYELNGWYWCIRLNGSEFGWIAKENLEFINQ